MGHSTGLLGGGWSSASFRWRRRIATTLLAAVLWACSSDASGPSPDPSVPASLAAVEGMGLQAPAGTILPEGPTVEVRDQYGDPMPDVAVTFVVQEGGGSIPVTGRVTDALGRARVPWILGRTPGSTQSLRASFGSLSAEFQAVAVAAVPGASYKGRNAYTEYLPGSLPLVLSAPHGGDMRPEEIPDRTSGTTVRDTNTRELALQIRDALHAQTGAYPHVVISHLHRIKLDPNREIVEAAQGNQEAERAWWEFQTFIQEAEELVEEAFGEGLYIDLHGHGHEIQRLELGYLLTATDLSNTNEILAGATYADRSSFRALAQKAGADLADLIRGPLSLGTLLEARGFPSVPSQNQPAPGSDPYFNGGYNTVTHGSRGGGTVSGVQIECNFTGVRDTEANRQALAEALGKVLDTFFPAHFQMEFAAAAPAGVP